MGKKGRGYFHEIPNVPRAQPLHRGPSSDEDRFVVGMDGVSVPSPKSLEGSSAGNTPKSGGRFVMHDGISELGGGSSQAGGRARHQDEPMLDRALSRNERERAASEVLMGRRTLLPEGEGAVGADKNGWGSPFPMGWGGTAVGKGTAQQQQQQQQQQKPSLDYLGSRPSTTSSSLVGKISTSPFDPRYPAADAPVAANDFMSVGGGSHLLPVTFSSKKDAYTMEKRRLVDKSPGASHDYEGQGALEQMEKLAMVHESRGMNSMRVRKARIQAERMARSRSLDRMRVEKIATAEKIRYEREEARDKVRRGVEERKRERRNVKEMSRRLNESMERRSEGFSQCLRACSKAGGWGGWEEGAEGQVEDIMGTARVTYFDMNDQIASADEVDSFGVGSFCDGGDVDDDDEASMERRDRGMEVSRDSLMEYSAALHMSSIGTSASGGSIYSGVSYGYGYGGGRGGGHGDNDDDVVGGAGDLCGSRSISSSLDYANSGVSGGGSLGRGFVVRKPAVKKLGSGFIVVAGGRGSYDKKVKDVVIVKGAEKFQGVLYNKRSFCR